MKNYQNPEILFRGITIPADVFSADRLTGDLSPGAPPNIDSDGKAVVADGNEYGVYMSDNPEVARVYATPRHGDPLPNSPEFISEKLGRTRIEMPRIGILYQINPAGIDIHVPEITSALRGVYNNGFQGNEFVASRVPSGSYAIKSITLGGDTLHTSQVIDPSKGNDEILAEIKRATDSRRKTLLAAQEIIRLMPDKKRFVPRAVRHELARHALHV